jgi:hypothetical protein
MRTDTIATPRAASAASARLHGEEAGVLTGETVRDAFFVVVAPVAIVTL